MEKLHPKAVYLFWIKSLIRWPILLIFLGIIFGWAIPNIIKVKQVISGEEAEVITPVSFLSLPWIIALIIFWLVGTYIWARLQYYFFGYEFASDDFKIEKGVILKKYVSIPYERIQNVDIHRGVIARFLGLSDLRIQTAGYSGQVGTEGHLPGLSARGAEDMRKELIRKAKGSQGI